MALAEPARAAAATAARIIVADLMAATVEGCICGQGGGCAGVWRQSSTSASVPAWSPDTATPDQPSQHARRPRRARRGARRRPRWKDLRPSVRARLQGPPRAAAAPMRRWRLVGLWRRICNHARHARQPDPRPAALPSSASSRAVTSASTSSVSGGAPWRARASHSLSPSAALSSLPQPSSPPRPPPGLDRRSRPARRCWH